MINVSFNELAIGSESPTQRPAPSRPAEASTFATMMDEADARLSANDRATETRASVETRDTARAERPAATEQPSSRETKDAPATADTRAKTTAPVARDKAESLSTDTTAAAPQDKASAPRDTSAETATAPATTQNTGENTTGESATTDTTEQPATPVAAAPQEATVQTPADDATANAAPIIIPVPAVALVPAPTQPAAIAPTFAAATATAPISAPQTAAPMPQSNDSLPEQPQPQQAASQPSMPQTTPASASNPDDAARFAALTSTAPTQSPATPILPAPTANQVANQAATNTNPTLAAANATTNTAPSKPADKAGSLTAATLFAATALSQPVTDSATQPPMPVTPQATAANTAQSAATQTAMPIVSQAATPADSTAPLFAATTTAETPAPVDPNPRQANTAPATQATAPNTAPTTAAASAPMTAATLAALIGTSNIDITIDQAAAPAPLTPVPSLANGMVAQIANAQSGETKTGTPTSLFGGVDGSAATQTAVPTQTAMAVAAAPTAQDVADEPKPKLAATADGLVINAPTPASGSHPLHTAATDAASAASKPAMPNQPVFDQVAVHVAKAAAEGLDKINIKLKPISLGQIDVQLEVATDGRVHAVIAADKPETLDLLQRDARSLERALGDAGLRTDSGSLSFNLRGQNQQQFGGNSSFAGFGGAERASNDIALPIADNAMRLGAYINSRAAAGGVDISV